MASITSLSGIDTLLSVHDRFKQGVQIRRELNPEMRHTAKSLSARFCQPVILAGMTSPRIYPLAFNSTIVLEAVQNQVESAFGQGQTTIEGMKDFQPVMFALPKAGQNRHLQRPLAELRFPRLCGCLRCICIIHCYARYSATLCYFGQAKSSGR